MSEELYAEFACRSLCHREERICGDNHIWRRGTSGGRSLAVVSDGLGHGVRANILSNLTSTMLARFVGAATDAGRIASMLGAMLPVDHKTNISYATFTLADIDARDGKVTLMQYDNPSAFVVRQGAVLPLKWSAPSGGELSEGRPGKLTTATFTAREGDRLVMVSDGVTQSGQRTGLYRFGWGQAGLEQYSSYLVDSNSNISSTDLALQVVSKASANDGGRPSDDITCAVVTFRQPRRLMVVSCPPATPVDHARMAADAQSYEGQKIVWGQPVADILAAQAGEVVEYDESNLGRSEYPVYRLAGFGMVTDGMIVPGRVLELLEHGDGAISGDSVPARVARMLLRNDTLKFLIGMRRNIDPHGRIPCEFSVRRGILRRIVAVLEKKYGKTVETVFY